MTPHDLCTILIVLVAAAVSIDFRPDCKRFESACASCSVCNVLAKYGKYSCNSSGGLMSFPRECITYRCERRGKSYLPLIVRIGCKSEEGCRDHGETWISNKRYTCMKYSCVVTGKSRKIQGDVIPCSG